jgi:putative oxidoreductase
MNFDEKLSLLAATLLRLALGAVFIAHALLKLLVFTLPGTVNFFEAHGFPGWTAYPVFAAELIGGTLLVIGFLTRSVSLVLIPIMIGAFLTHLPNGWNFTAPGGGWEYVAFLIVALMVQAMLGSGMFALQRLLLREGFKRWL